MKKSEIIFGNPIIGFQSEIMVVPIQRPKKSEKTVCFVTRASKIATSGGMTDKIP